MNYLTLITIAISTIAMTLPFVRRLQLNGYHVNKGYLKSILSRQYLYMAIVEVVMVVLSCYENDSSEALMAVASLIGSVAVNASKDKVKLKFTRRAVTLIAIVSLVVVGLVFVVPPQYMALFVPFIVIVASTIALPIEWGVARYYINLCRNKIDSCSATKIGITGSYGKTSVKHILAQLLKNAVASPHSYNTPMGIAKFVNSCTLSNYRYALFEMGARRKGEIAYLCDLVKPDIGIVTGIANQHILTFGNLDNVIATKQELMHYLSGDKLAFLNGYDSVVAQWGDVGRARKIISTDVIDATIDLVTIDGTTLTVKVHECQRQFVLPLLGIANVHNFVLAMSVCVQLGMDIDEIIDRAQNLKPIEHRMQVIKGVVTIIDDSYNANLQGITLCCDTVKQLTNCGRKIVIAQGIVEGGVMALSLNRAVAKLFEQAFDVVICVGDNCSTIFNAVDKELTVARKAKTLKHAVTIASQYYDENCILVFGNDIP